MIFESVTKLSEALADVTGLADELVICARRPWTAESECVVVPEDENYALPQGVLDGGFERFLEATTAIEVLEAMPTHLSSDERVRVFIYYAEQDAWPEWMWETAPSE